MFPLFCTYSRLRKYELLGKHGQIQYESYSLTHHSTRNFTLIPILKSKKYFRLRIQEKAAFEKICAGGSKKNLIDLNPA